MPFDQSAAMSFTTASVQRNAPACSGVYGLSNSRQWIFIGETSDLQASLMQHLQESGTAVSASKPTGFSFERSAPGSRQTRQTQLIREYHPFCNRQAA
jgi:hypothetical protein